MTKSAPLLAAAAMAAALCSPLACGSKASNSFGLDNQGGSGAGSGNSGSGSGSGGGDDSDSGTPSSGNSGSGSSSGSGVFEATDSGGLGTGTCQTGTYAGTFSCKFVADSNASADAGPGAVPDASGGGGGLGGLFNLTITGNLSFVVTESSAGELGTATALGNFVLNAGLTTGMATLGGTLNCGTGKFSGQLSDGSYSLLGGLFAGPFEGPLTSDYNGSSFAFTNGTWVLTVPGEGYCPGTWTAHLASDQ